jgi:hypothetical protein
MSTAELVKRMMDAGANSDAIAIAIQAVEEAQEAAHPRRRRKTPAKRPELAVAR